MSSSSSSFGKSRIRSLLIANRGEIAVRIIRAAREMGIRTVQIYSTADADSLAVKMADVSVEIGPPQASKSYLNSEAILQAARGNEVDAIHPGYGFFSENADFSDLVNEEGFIFIGPDGDTIRKMGDKVAARQIADAAGVPTVPGSLERLDDLDDVRRVAIDTGFPVLIKAAAGGGGRGIRIVNSSDEIDSRAALARAEALAAFGDGALYVEKFIHRARHVEVQILGDGVDVVHFFERECSLQRRRQKLMEEAPSATLGDGVRKKLCDAAVRLARSVHYKGAGTVEFLYDDDSGEFFFIEMNTRIQVEHPVSEFITGVDLIREMIRIAGGGEHGYTQESIQCRGHAIEVRINAEDPSKDFFPSPGVVTDFSVPGGPGVRFDGSIYSGFSIPPFYDSLLGKLIVWDVNRDAALDRLKRALDELIIDGVKTTKPLFQALVKDEDVRKGNFDTSWLESWLEKWPEG